MFFRLIFFLLKCHSFFHETDFSSVEKWLNTSSTPSCWLYEDWSTTLNSWRHSSISSCPPSPSIPFHNVVMKHLWTIQVHTLYAKATRIRVCFRWSPYLYCLFQQCWHHSNGTPEGEIWSCEGVFSASISTSC